jgi:mono/diheme cytochrome c family protein
VRLRASVLVALPVALVLGGALLLRRDLRERNLEVLPADMVRTRAPRAGGLFGAFPDGIVQRVPPAGTIPIDGALDEFGTTPEEAKRAGEVLENPVPASAATLARGAAVFGAVCAHCHGAGGLGDGPVTKRGVPPPPSLLRRETVAWKDGEMFHTITHGRKNMPSIAAQTTPDDRWRAIRYVRSLQEGAR